MHHQHFEAIFQLNWFIAILRFIQASAVILLVSGEKYFFSSFHYLTLEFFGMHLYAQIYPAASPPFRWIEIVANIARENVRTSHNAFRAGKAKPQSWHCQADTNTVDLSIGVSILISMKSSSKKKKMRERRKLKKQLLKLSKREYVSECVIHHAQSTHVEKCNTIKLHVFFSISHTLQQQL